MKTHPIYVPSKGRSGLTRGAILMLNANGVEHTVVVEPQDLNLYRRWIVNENLSLSSLEVLRKNNQGVSFARESVRQISIGRKESHHWQVNDDIFQFIVRKPGEKMRKVSPLTAISQIESEVAKYSNIGLAGPEENNWPPTEESLKVNALPAQAILVNNSVEAEFRNWPGFEDIDFMLQVFERGVCSLNFNHVRILAPIPGTNNGGLFGTDRKSWGEKFMSTWPQIQFNPGGSPGGRPNRRELMKQFPQRPQLV